MTETSSPPSITVEGGERIHVSAEVKSAAVASQTGGVGGSAPGSIPNPEVPEKPKRRQFTAEYKRSIVAQAEACRDDGAIGALLRREGLYSSPLTTWRRQKEQGELDALAPKKRGRKSTANLIGMSRSLCQFHGSPPCLSRLP